MRAKTHHCAGAGSTRQLPLCHFSFFNTGDMGALAATSPANSLAAANGTGSVAAAAAQSAAAAAAAGGGVSIANGLGSGVTGLAYLGGLAPLGGAGGRGHR